MFRDPGQVARWKVIQRARENFAEDIDTCNRENGRYIEGATRERERDIEIERVGSDSVTWVWGAYIHIVLIQSVHSIVFSLSRTRASFSSLRTYR